MHSQHQFQLSSQHLLFHLIILHNRHLLFNRQCQLSPPHCSSLYICHFNHHNTDHPLSFIKIILIPTAGFQHHSQPMFHSGSRPPSSMGPPFSQQPTYQMDYNQMERGSSNWMPPPLSENAAMPFLPPRPASSLISGDMEKALLQQVMSLTPEQINLLPPDQRNQVLHLQQMLRH